MRTLALSLAFLALALAPALATAQEADEITRAFGQPLTPGLHMRADPGTVLVSAGHSFAGRLFFANGNASSTHVTVRWSAPSGLTVEMPVAAFDISAGSSFEVPITVHVDANVQAYDRTSVLFEANDQQVYLIMRIHARQDTPSAGALDPIPWGDTNGGGATYAPGTRGDWELMLRNPGAVQRTYFILVHPPGDWSVAVDQDRISIPANGSAFFMIHVTAGSTGGTGEVLVGEDPTIAAYRYELDMTSETKPGLTLSADPDSVQLVPGSTIHGRVLISNGDPVATTVDLTARDALVEFAQTHVAVGPLERVSVPFTLRASPLTQNDIAWGGYVVHWLDATSASGVQATTLVQARVTQDGPIADVAPAYGSPTSIGANASEGSRGDWTIHLVNPSPQTRTFRVDVPKPGDWQVWTDESTVTIAGPNGTAELHVHSIAGTHGGEASILVSEDGANGFLVRALWETPSLNTTEVGLDGFVLGDLRAPRYGDVGAGFTVSGSVQNKADAARTAKVELVVNGRVSDSREVVLAAGQADRVVFDITPVVAGDFDVTLQLTTGAKLSSKTVTVASPAATPPTSTTPTTPTPGICEACPHPTSGNASALAALVVTIVPANVTLGLNASFTAQVVLDNPNDVDVITSIERTMCTRSPPGVESPTCPSADPILDATLEKSSVTVPAHGTAVVGLKVETHAIESPDNVIVHVAQAADDAFLHVIIDPNAHPITDALHQDAGGGVLGLSLTKQQTAAVVLGGVGGAAVVVAATRKKWPIVAAGLYARFAPSRLLEHPARARLRALVEAQPGITVNDAERASGLTHGTFTHHLQKLETGGFVLSLRDGQMRRLFVPGAEPPSARGPLAERIVDLVATRGAMRPAEVARELGESRQAVHYHVKKLVAAGELVVAAGGALDLPTTAAAA